MVPLLRLLGPLGGGSAGRRAAVVGDEPAPAHLSALLDLEQRMPGKVLLHRVEVDLPLGRLSPEYQRLLLRFLAKIDRFQ